MGQDWVPAYGRSTMVAQTWGATFIGQGFVSHYSGGAGEFDTFEGDEEEFIVERIVGTVSAYAGINSVPSSVCLRLLPMQANLTNIVPQLPWNPGDGDTDYVANFRYWWERRYVCTIVAAQQDIDATTRTNAAEVDHPYWTQVDIRPKQLVGRRSNLWPTLAYWNNNGNAQDLTVRWALRMLLKSVS